MFAAACLLVPVAAGAPPDGLSAADAAPRWVWAGDAEPDGMVRLRKTFAAGKRPKSATLTVAGDNEATVWLGGTQVLQTADWTRPEKADVTNLVGGGEKSLAVLGRNAGGPAGVLVVLDLKYPDGTAKRIVSDATWAAAKNQTGPDGWAWVAAEYPPAADWAAATDLGPAGVEPWGDVKYGDALPAPAATPADQLEVADGYDVELLYSVPKTTQGSWVAMTAAPNGDLVVSDQYGKLYRVAPPGIGDDDAQFAVAPIDVEIGMAQGLLCVGEDLYVVVNDRGNSGLYKVTDADGDGAWDSSTLLQKLDGDGEHGPHAVRLDPSDPSRLWVVAGNHTKLPDGWNRAASPVGNYQEDLLLPRNPDGNGHATGRMAPGGWVASCDLNGEDWRVYASGFRNPYDIAFNADGELFTFDADMEWDAGAPWYRPTRLNHVVSGGEYGWRYGTGKWPEYYADSVGAVVDLGLGSPTGVEFAAGTNFPDQNVVFLADWTNGRVFEATLAPDGASYSGKFRTFLSGRPLPVTDLCANPHDGCLYVTTGGRRTQSGLYRVRYVGDAAPRADDSSSGRTVNIPRRTRHMLERGHAGTPVDVAALWPHLGSPDRAIRYAARVALERHDPDAWRDEYAHELRPHAVIQASLALARTGGQFHRSLLFDKLTALDFSKLTAGQILGAARAYQLAFIRLGGHPTREAVEKVAAQFAAAAPHPDERVNREAVRLLTYLAATDPVPPAAAGVVTLGTDRLAAAETQADQMFYPFMLRNLAGESELWTRDQYETFFGWLNRAEATGRGGASFRKFVAQIRQDAVEKLSDEAKAKLKEVIDAPAPPGDAVAATTRQYVANWQPADFPSPNSSMDERDLDAGRAAYAAAKCAQCHRFAGEGGATGPDLTAVGGRFDARYLLEAILEPDKVISDQYRSDLILTADGRVYNGRVTAEGAGFVTVRTDPFGGATVDVRAEDILEREPSPVSEMPAGLVNTLSEAEVLDLVAYLRAGGDPRAGGE